MVEEDDPPILGVEVVLLGPVLVGDEAVPGPGQPLHLLGVLEGRVGDADALLDELEQAVLVLGPEDEGALLALELALDGRRDHVQPDELVQPVGRDLVLPALEKAAHLAAGILPGGLGFDLAFFKVELERLGHALADELEPDDVGRQQESFLGLPLGDLLGRELGQCDLRPGR